MITSLPRQLQLGESNLLPKHSDLVNLHYRRSHSRVMSTHRMINQPHQTRVSFWAWIHKSQLSPAPSLDTKHCFISPQPQQRTTPFRILTPTPLHLPLNQIRDQPPHGKTNSTTHSTPVPKATF